MQLSMINGAKSKLYDCKVISKIRIDDSLANKVVNECKKLIFEVQDLQQFATSLSKNIEDNEKWCPFVGSLPHIGFTLSDFTKLVALRFDSINIVLFK